MKKYKKAENTIVWIRDSFYHSSHPNQGKLFFPAVLRRKLASHQSGSPNIKSPPVADSILQQEAIFSHSPSLSITQHGKKHSEKRSTSACPSVKMHRAYQGKTFVLHLSSPRFWSDPPLIEETKHHNSHKSKN